LDQVTEIDFIGSGQAEKNLKRTRPRPLWSPFET